MLLCDHTNAHCLYGIDPFSCSVTDICQDLREGRAVSTARFMRIIDYLNRAIDGLAELGFIGSEALEWLDVFEKSESLEKETPLQEIPVARLEVIGVPEKRGKAPIEPEPALARPLLLKGY